MTQTYPNASMIRRGASMVYDGLLILAIMIVMSMPIASLDTGDKTNSFISDPILKHLYQLFLYLLIFAFYYVFWRMKGQTLGMQVWKIRAQGEDGNIMTPMQCIIRFAVATPGTLLLFAGFFWAFFDKEHLPLQDRLSHSRVVYMGDKPYASERPA
ncbi:MAG TPA: RDD family protein [Pseudomonadales bacterium]|nr:RDD family protein [Pseudomonadales bacterium]